MASKDTKKLNHSYITGGNVKLYSWTGKQSGSFLKKSICATTIYCIHTMALLGIYPREIKTHVYTKTYTWMFIANLFIKSQKLDNYLFNKWMIKQTAGYPYHGILFSDKKERMIDTQIWVNLQRITLN